MECELHVPPVLQLNLIFHSMLWQSHNNVFSQENKGHMSSTIHCKQSALAFICRSFIPTPLHNAQQSHNRSDEYFESGGGGYKELHCRSSAIQYTSLAFIGILSGPGMQHCLCMPHHTKERAIIKRGRQTKDCHR